MGRRVGMAMFVALAAVACGGTTVLHEGTGGGGASAGSGAGAGQGAGPQDRPTVCGEAPDALDGAYFLSLAVAVSPSKPAPFEVRLATTMVGDQVQAEMMAQPIDADDRVTKVGDAIAVGPFDVAEDGSFTVDWGEVTLPGETNPLTPSELVVDVAQDGSLCPVACGMVDGEILSPVMLDIAGSTFFMEKGGTADSHGEPPVLNCERELADPL